MGFGAKLAWRSDGHRWCSGQSSRIVPSHHDLSRLSIVSVVMGWSKTPGSADHKRLIQSVVNTC